MPDQVKKAAAKVAREWLLPLILGDGRAKKEDKIAAGLLAIAEEMNEANMLKRIELGINVPGDIDALAAGIVEAEEARGIPASPDPIGGVGPDPRGKRVR